MTLAHWDDARTVTRDWGHMVGEWSYLGEAAGSVGAGVRRVRIPPGRWTTPAHVHGREEEIFFVLDGSGLSWQNGQTFGIRPGDCLVHLAGHEAHTVQAGDGGIELLVFGTRDPDDGPTLPRAGVSWFGGGWVLLGGADEHPFRREAAAGPPETPPPSERPASIVNAYELDGEVRRLAPTGRRAGLNLVTLPPHGDGGPPHCHSAEEEIFVVLDGGGELELWAPAYEEARQTEPRERHPLRRGHVVARPPATRVPHSLRAGPDGLTYLAFGTREPNDICWYPRSNKVAFRGIGVIGRLEQLDYFDGEPG